MKPRAVIVDDQLPMARAMAIALRKADYDCETFTRAVDALTAVEEHGADVVVTDQKMPEMDGLELMRRLRELDSHLPIILVTAHGDVRSAVEAMRLGAFDYVTKPFDNDELRAVVARALELTRLHRENRYLRQELGQKYAVERFVAESSRSKELLELVRRVAPSKATVLIQGESGTGKELVAKLLHYWSDRVGRPFVAVNLKAFAAGVLESELFGHEKGAFTGASVTRAGCFERANGGSVFLDEIGEIDGDFQAKLLRVLQEGEVLRVGGERPHPIDVRVICATHRDLRAEVDAGRFREDLYFRLRVIPVDITPLRDRREDVLPLARFFVARHNAERRLNPLHLGADAEEGLVNHSWPGNVRELENAIERAAVLARGEDITMEDLLLEQPRELGPAPDREGTLQQAMDRAAEARVRAALTAASGARGEAAKALGIERTTLYRLMKRLGIE